MNVLERLRQKFAPRITDERDDVERLYFGVVDRLARGEDVPEEEIEDVLVQLNEPEREFIPDCPRNPSAVPPHDVRVTSRNGDERKFACDSCGQKWTGVGLKYRAGVESGFARLERDVELRKRRHEWADRVAREDDTRKRRDDLQAQYDASKQQFEDAIRARDEAHERLWPQLQAANDELASMVTNRNFLLRFTHDDCRVRELSKARADLQTLGRQIEAAREASGDPEHGEKLRRLEARRVELDQVLEQAVADMLLP